MKLSPFATIFLLILFFNIGLAFQVHPLHALLEDEKVDIGSDTEDKSLSTKLKNSIIKTKVNLRGDDPEKTIGLIINSIFGLLAVIFFILTIYGGFIWMTAAGNEAKIEKSKKIIFSGAIGIFIIFSSYLITVYIFSLLRPA